MKLYFKNKTITEFHAEIKALIGTKVELRNGEKGEIHEVGKLGGCELGYGFVVTVSQPISVTPGAFSYLRESFWVPYNAIETTRLVSGGSSDSINHY